MTSYIIQNKYQTLAFIFLKFVPVCEHFQLNLLHYNADRVAKKEGVTKALINV